MILFLSILVLAFFLFGFCCGKIYGRNRGYQLGITDAPLILRQESLEKGYCTLCGKEKR